ncbi:MerR family transcriptional regulator [Nocardia paucivorans]|uniref:MerR family transcriptional regulator n=1 Tax=Nocardia paucivorans TaxID=114259 RepID=UPI000301DCAE|nr:MerR family transcriptional regulator [Nocardia paucivorans]
MRIGELSRRTAVPARLLRYYEQQGLLESTRRSNGYRDYSDEAVEVVRRIRLLLEAGLNTETIRSLLPCVHGDEPRVELCTEVDDILRREVRAIDAAVDRLTRRRETLLGLLEPR